MSPQRRGRTVPLLFLNLALTHSAGAQESPSKESGPPRDIVIERLETAYRWQNDGTGETVQSARIRVLTEAGRGAVGQFYFPYSSQLEETRIDYFQTVKADGRKVPVDPSQVFEMASPLARDAPTFSDLKLKALAAPNLEVGDSLEYQVTHVTRVPLKPGDFWVIYFPNRQTVVETEVVVLNVPAGRNLTLKTHPEYQAAYSEQEHGGRKIYRWQFSNPHPVKSEEGPVKPLFAASTLDDWKQVGEWYMQLQAGRTQVTPEIQSLVAKLTAGKTTPREKLDAIYTYVSESIRYVAIHFGIGGFQAHAAADVLRNGYGDCKDKHGLLSAMLDAAGMKAYPVLANSQQGVIELDVPMPAQFDHVVSVVPVNGQKVWLDTTLEFAPPGFMPASMRGKQALLIDLSATRLAEIPKEPAVPENAHLTSQGRLDPLGKLSLENHFEMRGSMEVLYRKVFRTGNKDAILEVIKALGLLEIEGATTEELKSSDPTDLSQPFDVKYRLTDINFFGPGEKMKVVEVPHVLLQNGYWQSVLKKAEERRKNEAGDKGDIDLGGRGEWEENLDVEVDAVYEVDLPLPIHVERAFGRYDSTYTFDHGHLKTRRIVKVKEDKLPAERWQELEAFQKLMNGDLSQSVVLRRTGPTDVEAGAEKLTTDQLSEAGSRALAKGDFETARELLEKATAKDPRHKQAWNNLGRAYASLDFLDEAEKAYKMQIEINPSDEYAYNNLGLLYHRRGQYDQAVSAYKKQIGINPFDKLVYPNLAATYEEMGKWDEAAEAFEKARAVLHDNPFLFARMGNMYLKAGKVDEARRRFERALEMDNSPMTLNEVAYPLAEARVDLDKAQDYSETAVDKMAGMVQESTLSQTAPQYYTLLISLGSYLDTLGWVFFQKGQVSQAEPYLKAAFQLHRAPLIAEHLARVYAAQNNPNSAFRYYAFASRRPHPEPISSELESYIKERFGDPKSLDGELKEADESFRDDFRLELPGRTLTCPATPVKDLVRVTVELLVDETGAVVGAQAKAGDEPFRSAALQDARQAHFAPLVWPSHGLKTIRAVDFFYTARKTVSASWGFGTEFGVSSLLNRLNIESESPANAGSRVAKARRSDTVSSGLNNPARARTLEADSHFTLGAELEAKATVESQNAGNAARAKACEGGSSDALAEAAGRDFLAALDQYRLAHELEPANSSYKSAYDRLSRKLKQKSR